MPKKKRIDLQSYFSAADSPSIQSELVDVSDRAAAIVGAAALDVHLERLLTALMVEDPHEVASLVGSDNPGAALGSFSSRIRACYCLGLISRAIFEDLNRIRQIRNVFAHHVLECSFEHSAVKDICESFTIVNKMIQAGRGSSEWSPRTRFTICVYTLEELLRHALGRTIPRKSPPDVIVASD